MLIDPRSILLCYLCFFISSHVIPPLTIESQSVLTLSLTNFPWLSFSFYYPLELFLCTKENSSNTQLVLLITKRAGLVNVTEGQKLLLANQDQSYPLFVTMLELP